MRTLGIDFGSRNVGLSLSDEHGKIAFPHGVVTNDSSLEDTLTTLIRQKKVQRIVVGESRDFLGNPNPIMKKAKQFADSLADRTKLTVEYEPEVLTTVQALKARMGNEKPVAKPHRKESVLSGGGHFDDTAATFILQHYLERKRNEDQKLQSHERHAIN